jgi:hypothetical protein
VQIPAQTSALNTANGRSDAALNTISITKQLIEDNHEIDI